MYVRFGCGCGCSAQVEAKASEEDSSEDEEEEEEEEDQVRAAHIRAGADSARRSRWTLTEREFLWDQDMQVCSVSYNARTDMLVVGFTR